MKTLALLVGLAVVAFWRCDLKASDPVGIYAIVDRVVFEPSDAEPSNALPQRIQIWGAFVLSGPPGTGDSYDPPLRGHLYYALQSAQEDVARAEWSDLKKMAGTNQCLGLASRYEPKGRVRGGYEKPDGPDPYPISALGLTKLRSDTDYQPIRDLLSMPAPLSPVDGSSNVSPGQVTLVVRNLLDPNRPGAKYFFEIDDNQLRKEQSPEIPGGEGGQTAWSPGLLVRAGLQYHWRAWAEDGSWKGPVATADFKSVFLRGAVNTDSKVDISDAVALLEYLFAGSGPPEPLEAGDINDDGSMDITDSIYLLTYLFLGGPKPPPPFPEAGLIPVAQ